MTPDPLDYIALCPECQRLCVWISGALPGKEIAKDVAAAIRDGFSVERRATEEARAMPWRYADDCPKRRLRKRA